MKQCMCIVSLLLLILMSCGSDSAGGTVVDVNSGSIAGRLLYEGRSYKERVEVQLRLEVNDSLLAVDTVSDGVYRFDSLEAGAYIVQPSLKDGLLALAHGQKHVLDSGDTVNDDVEVYPIMTRTFSVVPMDSIDLSIDDFDLDFGVVEKDTADSFLYTLFFSKLQPSNSFSVHYSVGGATKSHKMYLDVFNKKSFELSTSSSDFGIVNDLLVTKTGKVSEKSKVKLYFFGSGNAYQHLKNVGDLIVTTKSVDTLLLKVHVSQTELSFEYESEYSAGEELMFRVELRDTLSNHLQFSGEADLIVPANAMVDLPILIMPEDVLEAFSLKRHTN